MCELFLLEQYVKDFQRFHYQSPQVQGKVTMGIFADYSKTFNTVDHTRILEKRNKIGFPKLFYTGF